MLNFDELNLSAPLKRAITELGYEKPSPIQAQALPILLGEATDFLGLAATGTGKTAAFGIPLLERIDAEQRKVQALILCPTRELANQVSGQLNILGRYKGIKSVAVYGGASFGDQVYGLKHGGAIVVGTPGRVIDHIERGTLILADIKTLVLDEADEMISMGFKDELETILKSVPSEKSNTWLFSATMSRDVRRVADHYLKNPRQVHVNNKEVLSENVEQYYYVTQESNKPEILCKLVDAADDFYGLVFCQTKALVDDLCAYLKGRSYKVDALHGDMNQRARETTMQAFRDRRVKMLICTDVAARGLDVKDVSHVVNYSLPRELDSYVHRIGRTARSGKSGVAMSLVTPANRRLVERIEAITKSRMQQGTIPSSKSIGVKKVSSVLARFMDQAKFKAAQDLMDETWLKSLAEMSQSEVAARFLSILMPELLKEPERNVFNDRFNKYEADGRRPSSRNHNSSRRPSRGSGPRREFSRDGGGGDRARGPRPPWKNFKNEKSPRK